MDKVKGNATWGSANAVPGWVLWFLLFAERATLRVYPVLRRALVAVGLKKAHTVPDAVIALAAWVRAERAKPGQEHKPLVRGVSATEMEVLRAWYPGKEDKGAWVLKGDGVRLVVRTS